MKIGVGGYYLGHSGIGLGVYTDQLLRTLSRIDRENLYTVFAPQGKESMPETFPANFDVRKHRTLPAGNQWARRAVWERTLSRRIGKGDLDVFHIPYLSFHPMPGSKSVVTVHDMAPCRFPVYRGRHVGRLYFDYIQRAVRKADHVITDSEFSKREIEDVLGIAPHRISVIPLAVPGAFSPVTEQSELNRVKEEYGLPDRFILYVGGFDIRKNVDSLLRAFASLKREKKTGLKLVLGGSIPADSRLIRRGAFIDILRVILDLGIGANVCLAGYIEEADLPAVYSSADLFVYPSLYEGFGLPVLEAMSCGAPVVVSGRSSLPEIVGREDLRFDPEDLKSIERTIGAVLSDGRLRKEISEWGLARAGEFSWEKTARETRRVYEGLIRA